MKTLKTIQELKSELQELEKEIFIKENPAECGY